MYRSISIRSEPKPRALFFLCGLWYIVLLHFLKLESFHSPISGILFGIVPLQSVGRSRMEMNSVSDCREPARPEAPVARAVSSRLASLSSRWSRLEERWNKSQVGRQGSYVLSRAPRKSVSLLRDHDPHQSHPGGCAHSCARTAVCLGGGMPPVGSTFKRVASQLGLVDSSRLTRVCHAFLRGLSAGHVCAGSPPHPHKKSARVPWRSRGVRLDMRPLLGARWVPGPVHVAYRQHRLGGLSCGDHTVGLWWESAGRLTFRSRSATILSLLLLVHGAGRGLPNLQSRLRRPANVPSRGDSWAAAVEVRQ
jgi:hypothetical protein